MRVLQVIPAVAVRYGGPSQAIFEMCRALGELGVDVLLATTNIDGQARLLVQLGSALEYKGVRTVFFSGKWGERFNYSPELARWLDLNVEKFDVVHVHAVFSHPCLAAARACRKRGVPYVVRPLGSLDPWSLSQRPLRKRVMWQLAAGRMMREAAAIHYTTSEEQRLAENALALNHGIVIPLGIDLAALQDSTASGIFRQGFPALGDRPYVLALSRIHPKKNLELLIETFLSLAARPELNRWRLVIAGEGDSDYVGSLHELVGRLKGNERVIFAGWLEGAMKVSAIQGASLFAMPSSQENFGIAAAEALACGVPVLVSEHVNLAAEIRECGAGWITTLERESFSRTLGDALAGEDERKNRGAAGKTFVEQRLSWSKAATELKQLYTSALRGSAPRFSEAERKAECTF